MTNLGCRKGGTCDLFEINYGWENISFNREGYIMRFQCHECGQIYKEMVMSRELKKKEDDNGTPATI